jgi:hypothetical protein
MPGVHWDICVATRPAMNRTETRLQIALVHWFRMRQIPIRERGEELELFDYQPHPPTRSPGGDRH